MTPSKEVVIRTGLNDPVAISLAKSLFEEAGIPYHTIEQTAVAYRDIESFMGWWNILVPQDREDEAREILLNVEATK
jgi:hypothetical protein